MIGDRTDTASPPQTGRRRSRIGAVLLWGGVLPALLLAGAGFAAWQARLPLANAFGPEWVSQALGQPVRFEATALSLDRIALEGLAIGDDGPRARRMEATGDLIARRLDAVRVDGLQATLARGPDGAPTVRGLALPDGGGSGGAPPPLPARVALSDLALTVETPAGAHRLAGRASLIRPQAAEGDAPFPLSLDLALQDSAGGGRVDLSVAIDAAGIEATGAADLDVAVWAPLIPGLEGASGRLAATIDLAGPPADAAPTSLEAALARVSGRAALTPRDLTLSLARLGPLTLSDVPITAEVADGGLTLTAPADFEAVLAKAPPIVRAALGEAPPKATAAPLRLRPADGAALSVRARRGENGWEIAADNRVHLVNGPISLRFTPRATLSLDGGLVLPLAPDARLDVAPGALAQGVRLRRPLVVTAADGGQASVSADGALDLDLALAARDVALTLPDGEMVDLFLPDLRPTISAAGVSLAYTGAAVHWAAGDVTATQLEGGIDGPAGGPYSLSLSAPEIVQAGAPLLAGTSAVEGALSPDGAGGWAFEGALFNADRRIETALSAALPAGGAPRLAFETGPIRYSPNGLQPGALSPLIDGLFQEVEGALSLAGQARLTPQDPAGRAAVRLDALGFRAGIARMRGLTGAVAFDLARAPATEPGQRLSARIAVAGLPAAAVDLTFALDAQARLLIDRLAVETLGGAAIVREAYYDPIENSFFGWVDLSGLSLAQALASLNVQGLDGEGAFSGTFPLTIEGTQGDGPPRVTVANGRIAAERPGVLRIDNPSVREYLGGRNQAVDMMVEALQDFRYDRLSADLDIRPDGAGDLTLSLFGRNPAVLQGQPFDLTITVETDFAKIFGTLGEAFSTTDALLERLARRAR